MYHISIKLLNEFSNQIIFKKSLGKVWVFRKGLDLSIVIIKYLFTNYLGFRLFLHYIIQSSSQLINTTENKGEKKTKTKDIAHKTKEFFLGSFSGTYKSKCYIK